MVSMVHACPAWLAMHAKLLNRHTAWNMDIKLPCVTSLGNSHAYKAIWHVIFLEHGHHGACVINAIRYMQASSA